MLPSPFFVDEVPADLGLDEAWMGREVLNSLLARREVATEDPALQHGALRFWPQGRRPDEHPGLGALGL